MFKRIVALVVALTFVLGVSSAFAQGQEGMKHQGMRQHRQEIMKAKTDKIKARQDELTKELNLTPEQGAKIKEILTRSHNEARAILEEAKAKVKEIRIKAHEEIKSLLTEAQKQKFQEIRKKHEAAPEIKE